VINPYSNGAQSTSSNYTVGDGDTVQSIAQALWGDASLWYMIAEANGLNAGSQLVAGQSLIIPDRVTNAHNNSDTFRVYDPNAAMGDLSPTSAKPPKKPGACAMIGQILMVAIAIGVSIITYGAMTGPSSTILGSVFAGAVSGAAGSVASQSFGVATGLQQSFNWKGVGMAAITGAIGGGLGKLQGLAEAGKLGSGTSIFGKAGVLAGGGFVNGAVRAVASSVLGQGIGVATGLQKNFDWISVATAGLGGGLSSVMSGAFSPYVQKGMMN
jgi:hypothetical protein